MGDFEEAGPLERNWEGVCGMIRALDEKQEEDQIYLSKKSTIQCLEVKVVSYTYENMR